MRKAFSWLGLATVCLLAMPRNVWAQELVPPDARQGYYISGGLVMVNNAVREDGTWYPTWSGGGFGFRIGQSVASWLDLGLSIDNAVVSGPRRDATHSGLTLEAQWRMAPRLALRTGLGLGVLSIIDNNETDPDDERSGRAGDYYTVGLSIDWFPFFGEDDVAAGESGGFAVSPLTQFRFMPGGDIVSVAAWLGVEFTWWSGLPKNQLDLSVEQAFTESE